jgi:hypothetical protein
MVKGKLYKLANLDKNKRNNLLMSYARGVKDGIGWLWTTEWATDTCTIFRDGDAFVCLGKKENHDDSVYYGIPTWYEALGPDGKIHKFTPAMRSSYFRSP